MALLRSHPSALKHGRAYFKRLAVCFRSSTDLRSREAEVQYGVSPRRRPSDARAEDPGVRPGRSVECMCPRGAPGARARSWNALALAVTLQPQWHYTVITVRIYYKFYNSVCPISAALVSVSLVCFGYYLQYIVIAHV